MAPNGSFELAGRPVRRIGFGAMQLPGPGVFGPPRDRKAALAILRRAVELGVNHIDTADYYGPDVSNPLIREALRPYPDDLVLVSKVGAARTVDGGWIPAQRPEQLRAGVEANLRSLAVERVDVVNLRRMGPDHDGGVPLEDQLGAMVELRDEGKVGAIGLSNVSIEEFEEGLAHTNIACLQNPMNLLSRGDERSLDLCRERAIAYVPFFPLGSAFAGMPKVIDQPVVQAIAGRLQATPAQVGLAWLLHHAANILLIPGTSSVEHLEENVGALDVALDAEELSQLDAAAE